MLNLQSYALVSAALSHAGVDQQRLERLARLEDRRLTPETELPPMQFLFRLFGKPCFPRGELVALTGKPKAGKTFVSSVLMSLFFSSQLLSMKRDDLSPLSQKYLLGWENNHPRLDIALLFADALPEENVKCPAKQLQESVMTLCCMTSVYLYNSLREKALKESIIVKSADEFGHVAYYRPSAAGQERQTPAVPDDAEPELNLWGTPPGEVPF